MGNQAQLPELQDTEEDAAELSMTNRQESQDDDLKEWLTLVRDNTLEMHRREMPAYWKFLEMVREKDFRELSSDARNDLKMEDFFRKSDLYRGELASFELNVRRVSKYTPSKDNPAQLSELYEVWGWTNQSQAWVYVFVAPELPLGMKMGEHVQYKVRATGYYFKLQGYHSAHSKPSDRPLVAPLFIGKFELLPANQKKELQFDPAKWMIVLGITSIASISIYFLLRNRNQRNSRRPQVPEEVGGDQDPLDWLDPPSTAEGKVTPIQSNES